MAIYLDNAATTACDREAAALMTELGTACFGNPSSAHRMGYAAELKLREAAEQIAKTLSVSRQEILFTSGGTEADNLALFGAARANARKGKRIITNRTEHPAVLNAAEALREEGFEVVYIPVDENGILSLSALAGALTEDTVLVSVMAVNNEIGTVQPLEEIGEMVKSRAPQALFHTDAVQAYGKIPLPVKEAKIDLLAASAHKLHGPKGTGFLYVRKGVRLTPLLYGGGQQDGIRSGTENVPGYCGMAYAATKAHEALAENTKRLYRLREDFCSRVKERIPDVKVNGAPQTLDGGTRISPYIVSLSVRDVRAEVLLHALEEKEIYVSAGSACASHHHAVSATLKEIGLEEALAQSTIRISMSSDTTGEECDALLEALEELVPQLRRFRPR